MEFSGIYLDNAGTTAVLPEVVDEMLPYFCEKYGNASSIHEMGADAADGLRTSRKRIASSLGCYPSEITFTSGGTESDNIALMGVMNSSEKKKIITTAIEHSAVLETCYELKRRGFDVSILKVDNDGFIDLNELNSVIDENVALVSVMAANNVIGTIQDLPEIGKIAHENGALFHTDAVQGFTKMDINVKRDNIDLLSISGHKVHGPKGIGALYVKDGVKISPIMFGGGQERGLRSSTENIPGIVGFGKAVEISIKNMEDDVKKMTEMRNLIIDTICDIDGAYLNGPRENRLCNNAHFCFDGVKGSDLVLKLNKYKIYTSTASACSAGDTEPSHVLSAIGRNTEQAMSALRVTLSQLNTMDEIEKFLEILPEVVKECRN